MSSDPFDNCVIHGNEIICYDEVGTGGEAGTDGPSGPGGGVICKSGNGKKRCICADDCHATKNTCYCT